MRLEKGMIKDVKLGREEVVGLKLNGTYLFETTGLSYWNKYTIQIPRGKYLIATISDKDTSTRNENNYALYVDWGTGTPVQYGSDTNYAQKTYNTSGISTPYVTYTIKTTGELQLYTNSNDLGGEYVTDIASVRTDFKTGASLFSNYSRITTIREPVLERLNTKVFTSMNSMFYNCSSMEKLNLASFDTSNVTDMYCMFSGCEKLTSLDVSHFNTDKVTNMSSIFGGCELLTKLDLSKWNTNNATRINGMFSNCKLLTKLDLSNFRTSNVKYMTYMFSGCSSLTELNLSYFDTSKVLRSGQIDPDINAVLATDGLYDMFKDCSALRILNLANCSKDTVNDIITSGNFPTGRVNGQLRTIYCTEEASDGLTVPDGWTFRSEIPDVPVDPPEPEEPEEPEELPLYQEGQFAGDTTLIEAKTMVTSKHYSLSNMFNGCINLTSVTSANWDTSNVSKMDMMFYSCRSLVSLDLSNCRPDITGSFGGQEMFANCVALETLDIRNFNINYYDSEEGYVVKDMFKNCNSLHTLYLNNCNAYTLSQILREVPRRESGTTGVIYLKQANMRDEDKEIYLSTINCPFGWRFEYVD